jgi:hypothetical protein
MAGPLRGHLDDPVAPGARRPSVIGVPSISLAPAPFRSANVQPYKACVPVVMCSA